MKPTAKESPGAIISVLKKSPLFQLSLTSKELFHSNFLAWLCESYPEPAGRLFARFLKQVPLAYDHLKVDRERKNIDLWLGYPGGGELIIENKVKSLAALPQLEKYAGFKLIDEKATLLLLSLTRPTFLAPGETEIRTSNDKVWKYLSYGDLAEDMRALLPEIRNADLYHGHILSDYIEFITQLDRLTTCIEDNWETNNFFVNHYQDLKTIRMHDLVDKLRYARLAERVEDMVKKDIVQSKKTSTIYSNYTEFWDKDKRKVDDILITFGMTRGVGLFDFKYSLIDGEKPVLLVVQIQKNQFRLAVEVPDPDMARKVFCALWKIEDGVRKWFNFELFSSELQQFPRVEEKKDPYNQYGHQFLYRYVQLGNISPPQLVEKIVEQISLICAQAPSLRELVKAAL